MEHLRRVEKRGEPGVGQLGVEVLVVVVAGGWGDGPHTQHQDYSCRRGWRTSENNSTFSTVFTHVSVPVDKHGNPFIYKGTLQSILDNVSFMVSYGGPFFPYPPLFSPLPPTTKPPDWLLKRLLMGRLHLIHWKHCARRGRTRRYSGYEDRQGKPRCHYCSALTPSLSLAAWAVGWRLENQSVAAGRRKRRRSRRSRQITD